MMEAILRFEKNTKFIDETNHSEAQAEVRKVSKKLKALNFRASLLKIGIWKEIAEQVEGLIVRCYFAKEKLAWEISRKQSLKKKIEIKWSDILAIRAKIMEDGTGVLEIELNRPPSFYEESTPIPRKHTIWNISSDFTGGQALNYRAGVTLTMEEGVPQQPLVGPQQADANQHQAESRGSQHSNPLADYEHEGDREGSTRTTHADRSPSRGKGPVKSGGNLQRVQTLNFHSNMASGSLCSTEALLLDLKYLDSHEWVKVEGNSATVGVTDHAQDHLGKVVEVNKELNDSPGLVSTPSSVKKMIFTE
nr:glycine cleavage system h protein 2, mitochondrial [Quercus suber]